MALIPRNWAFNYLKYSVRNVLRWVVEDELVDMLND
jgi:hypothetical protein